MATEYLPTSISYPVVIGLSLFSIVWGVINVILVSKKPLDRKLEALRSCPFLFGRFPSNFGLLRANW